MNLNIMTIPLPEIMSQLPEDERSAIEELAARMIKEENSTDLRPPDLHENANLAATRYIVLYHEEQRLSDRLHWAQPGEKGTLQRRVRDAQKRTSSAFRRYFDAHRELTESGEVISAAMLLQSVITRTEGKATNNGATGNGATGDTPPNISLSIYNPEGREAC